MDNKLVEKFDAKENTVNSKKAILVVSFGSSFEEARKKGIEPIERLITDKYSNFKVVTAYTSNFIRAKLKKQGILLDSTAEALGKLLQEGYREIYVQPLHVLAGFEFEKIERAVKAAKDASGSKVEGLEVDQAKIYLGRPLMSNEEDIDGVKEILVNPKEGLTIYIGHGTDHSANLVYEKLEEKLRQEGSHTFVGTIEVGPRAMLERLECLYLGNDRDNLMSHIEIKPLLLVAGDHVINDISGPSKDSWINVFQQKGYELTIDKRGIGELAEFQQLFLKRVDELIVSNTVG